MPNRRKKPYRPRPVVIPQMLQGYDTIASVRAAVAGIRAQFAGSAATISRQSLADLNMVWQQVTKVHERAGIAEPSRAAILTAHNTLARLNADAEISAPEFEHVVATLERILHAVRRTPPEIWQDVELTLNAKEALHGTSPECWLGGVLLPERTGA